MANPLIRLLSLTKLQSRIPIINKDLTPSTAFLDTINRAFMNIENSSADQADVLRQLVAIAAAQGQIIKRVGDVETAVEAKMKDDRLINSYTDPTGVMTSEVDTTDNTKAIIRIAAHRRVYTDGISVPVTGGFIPNLALNTLYYVFYDDPNQVGGDVTYKYSTVNTDAAQVNGRHSLSAIYTPANDTSPPTDGGGVTPPGGGRAPIRQNNVNEQ